MTTAETATLNQASASGGSVIASVGGKSSHCHGPPSSPGSTECRTALPASSPVSAGVGVPLIGDSTEKK
jgi:hypothetical protein